MKTMPDQPERSDRSNVDLTRREAIGRFALFGTAMAILQSRAYAQSGATGSYSNSAIALPEQVPVPSLEDDLEKAVKIARAMRAGALRDHSRCYDCRDGPKRYDDCPP